tara:strand:- start:1357 stop:2454 length:1098 start_codon:yes stop_codon:yes gene_type:complete
VTPVRDRIGDAPQVAAAEFIQSARSVPAERKPGLAEHDSRRRRTQLAPTGGRRARMGLPLVPLAEPPRALAGAEMLADPALRGLADLPTPPASLHLAGVVPRRMVAIVGTRRSDPEAERFTHRLARDLAEHGIATISGGALGIDAAAHEGCLTGGAPTLAVLATHPSWAYPARHRGLFGRIVDAGGGLLGEHEDGNAFPGRFLQRNRLVAALASAVVVVQAPRRSGALSTARVARSLGRPVFVVPAAPWDPRGGGNVDLLVAGATPCTGWDSLATTLDLPLERPQAAPAAPTRPEAPGPSGAPGASAMGKAVWEALGAVPLHPDELGERLERDVVEVQRALLELVVLGAARAVEGGRYLRSSAPA